MLYQFNELGKLFPLLTFALAIQMKKLGPDH